MFYDLKQSKTFFRSKAIKPMILPVYIPRVCVCVFTSIHLEDFICLGLVVQGTDQRCCVEDVFFLYQVPSSILQYGVIAEMQSAEAR